MTTAELIEADGQGAGELLADHEHAGVGGRDATVFGAMDRFDVSRLWTHDDGLRRLGDGLDWLAVTDPVG